RLRVTSFYNTDVLRARLPYLMQPETRHTIEYRSLKNPSGHPKAYQANLYYPAHAIICLKINSVFLLHKIAVRSEFCLERRLNNTRCLVLQRINKIRHT